MEFDTERDVSDLARLVSVLQLHGDGVALPSPEAPRGDEAAGREVLRSLVGRYLRGGMKTDELTRVLVGSVVDIYAYGVSCGSFVAAVESVLPDSADDHPDRARVTASGMLGIAAMLGFVVPSSWQL